MTNASTENNGKKKRNGLPENSLKGTFTSVLIIAVFMLLSWFGVFILFLERN